MTESTIYRVAVLEDGRCKTLLTTADGEYAEWLADDLRAGGLAAWAEPIGVAGSRITDGQEVAWFEPILQDSETSR